MEGETQRMSTFQMIVGIATIIGAIAILVKVFGKSDEEKVEQQAKKSRKKTYTDITYPDFRYKDWGDELTTALMEGVSEDEQTVYDIFAKMKTLGDVNKLIEGFGTSRQQGTFTWLNLPQAINTYFSAPEKKKLNMIIAGNGIDYTFE